MQAQCSNEDNSIDKNTTTIIFLSLLLLCPQQPINDSITQSQTVVASNKLCKNKLLEMSKQ